MSEAVRAFDRSANGYDNWYREAKGRQVLKAESALVDLLIPSEGVGLEIGAGTGVFAEYLTDTNRIVVCLDLSTKMLIQAKGRDLSCILGSAESLPIRQGVLDFTYMITVIEFLLSPEKAFREAAKISAPLVVLFVNRDSSWGRLYTDMAKIGDPIFCHARLYSLEDVAEFAKTAKLTKVEAYGTLTTNPTDPDAGDEIVEPNWKAGVIAVKLSNRTH